MFAVLLFLVFSASHVQYAVNGFPANTLALPQVNETHGALGDKHDTLASNISDLFESGYHWTIPETQISIHITVPANPRPLPPKDTVSCLQNFIYQFGLFRPEDLLIRLRYGVFENVKVTLAPSHAPLDLLTYRKACKVIGGLGTYIWKEGLLVELRFGVFDKGLMVAWGSLRLRDEPPAPPTPPKPQPIPTAVQ